MTTELDIDDIIEILIKADDAYFNDGDTPVQTSDILSDSEYDKLKQKAYQLAPGNVYFSRIGSDVRGGKTRLPYTMGSLDQVYTGEIGPWVQKLGLTNEDAVISNKLDGISCMLVYRSKGLEIGYSRGNGTEGADITRHLKHIPNLPQNLDEDCYMVIRGELIMKKSVHADKWTEFANPRVAVAGPMNRKLPTVNLLADVNFIAYEIVATDSRPNQTKEDQLERLKSLGFATVEYLNVPAKRLSDSFLTKFLEIAQATSEYELDGLVITANKIDAIQNVRTAISLNPEHSCKFKVNDPKAEVEATVVDVIWEISKSGYWKPRVEIIPVPLFGTTVTFATGFNGKFIVDNAIGKGAVIRITKSGTVIPFIVSVTSPAPRVSLPDNSEGTWGWNENKVEIVLDDVDASATVRFKQVLSFIEKLNVDLLKESTLRKVYDHFKLWDAEFTDAIATLIDLKESEWNKAVGSNGSKSYASLHRRLQNMEMATLIGASKYMGVGFGIRKAKSLLASTNNDDVWNLTESEIANMDGFDTKTATAVINGLPKTKKFVDMLLDSGYVSLVQLIKTDEFKLLNVVMTGFRDADLAAEIEKRGGKIGSSVSKKTSHLLTFDAASNSGKAKKAKELGVKVMTPDEFKDEFNL